MIYTVYMWIFLSGVPLQVGLSAASPRPAAGFPLQSLTYRPICCFSGFRPGPFPALPLPFSPADPAPTGFPPLLVAAKVEPPPQP